MRHCLPIECADLMPMRSQYLNLASGKTLSLLSHRAFSQSAIPLRHIGAVRHAVLWNLAAAEDLTDSHSISFIYHARQRLCILVHKHLLLGTDFGSRV